MDDFFKSIERPAYRMAHIACSNRDDALDLVQDSMCKFVDKYSNKPPEEWKALFYRTLQNKIRDYYRKHAIRSRWQDWFSNDREDGVDPLAALAVDQDRNPEQKVEQQQALGQLETALRQLSLKQQQIFLLRTWQGLSTREAAHAMGCSEGTVKTQLSRASARLKGKLGDDWP